mmetsp:Transcript_10440/g.45353  ORF Transcript_10440/g.45353 Transcript_10440/m.45353 type:complete len:334 (+) Transcript_10440:368-1369(+)
MLPDHRRRRAVAVRGEIRRIAGAADHAELRQVRGGILLRRVAAHHAGHLAPQQRPAEALAHPVPHPHLCVVHGVLHPGLLPPHTAGAVGKRRHAGVQRHARHRRVAGDVHADDQQGGHPVHHDPARRRSAFAARLPPGLRRPRRRRTGQGQGRIHARRTRQLGRERRTDNGGAQTERRGRGGGKRGPPRRQPLVEHVRSHRVKVHGAGGDVREAQQGAHGGGWLDERVVGRVEGVAGEQLDAPRGRVWAHIQHVLGAGAVNHGFVPAVHSADVLVQDAVPVCRSKGAASTGQTIAAGPGDAHVCHVDAVSHHSDCARCGIHRHRHPILDDDRG